MICSLAFGLGAAVLEFNRVAAHITAVARRWLALPVFNFYDDFRVLDTGYGGGDEMFQHLVAWLGWRLDPKKHQGPARLIIFLGTQEDSESADARV